MPDMLIRNIAEDTMAMLKEQAILSGRSVQKEALGILSETLIARKNSREAVNSLKRIQARLLVKNRGKLFPDSTAGIRKDRKGH